MHKEQRKRAEKDSKDRSNGDQDERDPDHDNNRDFASQRFGDKRKSARKIEGFGMSANYASYEDRGTLKSESVMLFDWTVTATTTYNFMHFNCCQFVTLRIICLLYILHFL